MCMRFYINTSFSSDPTVARRSSDVPTRRATEAYISRFTVIGIAPLLNSTHAISIGSTTPVGTSTRSRVPARGRLLSRVSPHGPAAFPTDDCRPLGGAQPADPPRAARRRLASLERGRSDPAHPHNDRLEVPAAVRGARPRRAAAARFPDVRISPPQRSPPPRARPRGRRRPASRGRRLLRRVLPLPLRTDPIRRHAVDRIGDVAPPHHGPPGAAQGGL